MTDPKSSQLTSQDVQRLLSDPSPTTRAAMAAKVAIQLDRAPLTQGEREIAESIVRVMARDATLRVRQALSENLKNATTVPHDIAKMLAQDVDVVSLPMIEACSVLTDDDLLELIHSGAATKQTAVARRSTVSLLVADALVETADETAVAALVSNEGATLDEHSLNRVVDRFGNSEAVQTPLVHRNSLPITVSERLVTLVSDNLREHLVTHHELPPDIAADLMLQTRERATVRLVDANTTEQDVENLARQLEECGRLTPSLLLRSLCMGDMAFFEAAMAVKANVPLTNARLLIHDAGKLGMKSLYDKADLPPGMLPAVRVAVDIYHETAFDGGDHDRERHQRRMIERILTQLEDYPSDDIPYLLNKLSDLVEKPV